jgi:hypothetical protein
MSAFQAHKVLAIGGTGAQGVPVVQGLYFTTTLAFCAKVLNIGNCPLTEVHRASQGPEVPSPGHDSK